MMKQSGFSLVELLMSLFLAAITATALSQVYLSSKAYYMHAEEVLEGALDLLWVSDLLADSVRRAGFTPCLNINYLLSTDSRNVQRVLPAFSVHHNPDSLQVNRMGEPYNVLQIQNTREISLEGLASINSKRPIVIADCTHAEVHEVADLRRGAFNSILRLKKPLLYSYTKPVYLGEWLEEKWFIRKNLDKNPAFYYQLMHPEELTPLIHSLKIKERQMQDKLWLEFSLGLDKGQVQELMVGVRG